MYLAVQLSIALVLPLLLGIAPLLRWWSGATASAGVRPLLLGYGWLLGWLLVAVALWVWGSVGLKFSAHGAVALASVLSFCLAQLASWLRPAQAAPAAKMEQLSKWEPLAAIALLCVIGVRFYFLAHLNLTQPLTPWDAWVNWAPKARAWFEVGHMVPFLPHAQWIAADTPAYTMYTAQYPPGVPLIELWTALWLGVWNDSLVGAPWVTALLALLLAMYGQLRGFGASKGMALLACYLLASLPILDVHVALPGYADLWLAASVGAAAMALWAWIRDGDRRQAGLAVLFVLACLGSKAPGIGWVAALAFGVLTAMASRRTLTTLAATATAVFVAMLFTRGIYIDLPNGCIRADSEAVVIPHLIDGPLGYVRIWDVVFENLFRFDNWHLLWYSLPVAFWIGLRRLRSTPWVLAGLFFVVAAFAELALLFSFTNRAQWVLDNTITNRAFLHLVPAYVFLFAAIWAHPSEQLMGKEPT